MDEREFAGKTALVTGAGSGIGRASAIAFAAAGAHVFVADRDSEGGDATVAAIVAKGGAGTFIRCDVGDRVSVDQMFAQIFAGGGKLHFAHNNAGVTLPSALSIPDMSEEDFDINIAVNLKGVWLCLRHELSHMRDNGGGAIVNTSSVGGLRGLPMGGGYCAAKHGVVGITKTAALEFASAAIRVNAICPGLTRTGMTRTVREMIGDEQFAAMYPPMQRIGDPDEIAKVSLFLCSSAASFMTGECVTVDGGYMAA